MGAQGFSCAPEMTIGNKYFSHQKQGFIYILYVSGKVFLEKEIVTRSSKIRLQTRYRTYAKNATYVILLFFIFLLLVPIFTSHNSSLNEQNYLLNEQNTFSISPDTTL